MRLLGSYHNCNCDINGVEFNVMSDGSVMLISCTQPNFELKTPATVTGVSPRAVLTLDRKIILRMLLQGYTAFSAHSDGLVPVIASGGSGQYIAMPIRSISKNPIQPKQEEKKMEENNNVVEQTAPVVNPETLSSLTSKETSTLSGFAVQITFFISINS